MRDPTAAVARRLRRRLEPGERVDAGLTLAAKGTFGASLSAAARAADGVPTIPDAPELAAARAELADAGVDGVRFWVALTDRRLLVAQRTLLNRTGRTVLDVPVSAVVALRTSTQGQTVTFVLTDGRELTFETPKAFRFLPPVYAELPERLRALQER